MSPNDLDERDVRIPRARSISPTRLGPCSRRMRRFPRSFPGERKRRADRPGRADRRAGDVLAPVDLETARQRTAIPHRGQMRASDTTCLVPDVPESVPDFDEASATTAMVAVADSSLHGARPEGEIAVSMKSARPCIVRQTGRSDQPDDEGLIKVLFEFETGPSNALMRSRPRGGTIALLRHGRMCIGVRVLIVEGSRSARRFMAGFP